MQKPLCFKGLVTNIRGAGIVRRFLDRKPFWQWPVIENHIYGTGMVLRISGGGPFAFTRFGVSESYAKSEEETMVGEFHFGRIYTNVFRSVQVVILV